MPRFPKLKLPENSFSVVIFHYGDLFWTEFTLNQIIDLENQLIKHIYIVNQDRNFEKLAHLNSLDSRLQLVMFPVAPKVDINDSLRGSFDHATSLNRFMKTQKIETTHLIILDNDCFPIKNNWLLEINNLLAKNDALIAEVPKRYYLTHPCLMVLPKEILPKLDFAEGMIELGFDTGRLIGLQCIKNKIRPYILLSDLECDGLIGISYLKRNFIHLVATSYQETRKVNRKTDKIRILVAREFKKNFFKKWKVKNFPKVKTKVFKFSRFNYILRFFLLVLLVKKN